MNDRLISILLLSGFFALLVAGYGGIRAGLITFVVGTIVMLAAIGISFLDTDD